MSVFATRLKELRGAESQASFAAALGVNRVQYAKYESGANSPSVDILERICRAHACSADWLLGLRDDSSSADLPHHGGSATRAEGVNPTQPQAGVSRGGAAGSRARVSPRATAAQPTSISTGDCSKCKLMAAHLREITGRK